MASVELKAVEKRFGDTEVVKGIDLSIAAGEFLVLVGPSGCGKSTTLRMIAGLESVSAGEVHIGDRKVNDVAPKDRDIGMVFQSYALYPHMTVKQNLAFGLSLRKTASDVLEKRVAEAAELLELSELLARKPKQLSGGQRQRVAIGRAIVREPAVFLFDEPLSNLDASLRVQMRQELAALHRRLKTTMIYVTHDQVEAMMLADRIAVLDSGNLMQVGSPLELYNAPQNRFVAGFIGSPAMNFLSATRDGNAVVVAGTTVTLPTPLAASTGDITVGIRPHDITVGTGSLRGTVTLVEPLGWEAFVHLNISGGDTASIVARAEGVDAARYSIGDELAFELPAQHLHVFGSDGAALLDRSAPA